MLNFDHIVLHVNNSDEVSNLKSQLDKVGIPFEPSWGKKAKGFQISNIWIGQQYFEIVDIYKDQSAWQPSWVKRHKNGDRGAYCIFVKSKDSIDELHNKLAGAGIAVTQPERTTFKWFFNLLEKRLPWRFFITPKIPGTNVELGFIQYDEGAEEKFAPYMVPNSSENGVTGIANTILYTRELQAAEQWLNKVQDALGDKISISIKEQLDEVSVTLEVESNESSVFNGAKVFDVLLQPQVSSLQTIIK